MPVRLITLLTSAAWALTLALPLLWAGPAAAESGAHRAPPPPPVDVAPPLDTAE